MYKEEVLDLGHPYQVHINFQKNLSLQLPYDHRLKEVYRKSMYNQRELHFLELNNFVKTF